MTPELIKYALALRRYTQRDIARDCSVEASTVSMVVNGRGRSRKVEMRIASVTGQALADLWPQWHGPKARSTRSGLSHAQVAEALRAIAG